MHEFIGAAGRQGKGGASGHHLLDLGHARDGARAQVHLRHGAGHGFHGLQRHAGAQGDLHHVDAAFEQGVGQGNGMGCVVEHDHRDDAGSEGGAGDAGGGHGVPCGSAKQR
ncbi:hypothetical protein D9M68_853250 [compost metagenome]